MEEKEIWRFTHSILQQKTYSGITLTSIAAKVYNVLLLNRIEPDIRKLGKKSEWFSEKSIHITDSKNLSNLRRISLEKSRGNTIVSRFLQGILANSSLKKTVITIMVFSETQKSRFAHEMETNRLLRHCCWSSAMGYISTISVYNLPRLRTLNVDRSNKKWLYT